MGRPSRNTAPSLGGLSPEISRRRVVFPDPDGPTTASSSPAATSKETSLSAAGASFEYRLPRRETRRPAPSACKLTGRPRVPGQDTPLDDDEQVVQQVAEQAEEEDAAVHLRHVVLRLLERDVAPESVARAGGELGDHEHDEADRERDAQPGNDRRERRREVDAVEPLHGADLQHRGGVARLWGDGADALDGVDEHRKADAERDYGDPRTVAEAEDHDRHGHDRDRRDRAQELGQRRERPSGTPKATPIPAPIPYPAASRFRLAAAVDRNSRVGHTCQARSTTVLAGGSKNDALLRAHASQRPSATRSTAGPRSRRHITAVPGAPRRPRTRRAPGLRGARR